MAPAGSDARASSLDDVPSRSLVVSLVIALRPEQWTKNLVLFAALIFGARLFDPTGFRLAAMGFATFCALSSSIYLVNDLGDRAADREHPVKRRRPVASGAVPAGAAAGAAIGLGLLAIATAFWLSRPFGASALAYGLLQLGYTAYLKRVVVLDVIAIAMGFVIRALAGGLVTGVAVSGWLLLCTTLLALFLALSKRRHEIVLLDAQALRHRQTLGDYSPYLLDQMLSVVTATTLTSYAFYTLSQETVEKFGDGLIVTFLFPLYGLFRYLYLVHRGADGGSPSDVLLTDLPLLTCVALWAATVIAIIYGPSA